ncbi:CoB--CoM heterodisulfide reductase subunit C [Methanotorris formicicus]|uniref:CoB/CoM heterodisulfide reductase, subunit C n=1 Tax=Methanotorris formicicus Mc-S-70 TaxID=647171 RepID=H1L173_9EURY|nr:CoB--CoM heterodisulfide reductase subunit C [Methanotorris formicicus]EHP83973.1 CoB/CoM heterodisulfide reductase, subunit C [Methanotorris formicicus Mc-S-70]
MILKSEEDFDNNFVNEIIETGKGILGEEHVASFKACYQCGTCTGSCPSGRITAFKTRKLIKYAQFGMRKYAIESEDLWMCTTCYECYERCPREVKITDIIKVIRNIAAREGKMAKAHRMTALYVFKTGHAVPINEETKKARKLIGLNEVPPTTHKYPEVLEVVRRIMKDMKFCDIVGICTDTAELKPVEWKDMSE